MARDFDGVNDKITFGSDASIDGFVTQTIAFFVKFDTFSGVNNACLVTKQIVTNAWWLGSSPQVGQNKLTFTRLWTALGDWISETTFFNDTDVYCCVVTYDGGAVGNDPVIVIDGVTQALTEFLTPSGSLASDAALTMSAGEESNGDSDLDAAMGWLTYANAIWTAAQKNRFRWWGSPGGPVAVYHPFVTDSLVNKGTAVADGVATGTTMRSMPKVERNHMSMLGVGR